MLIKRSTEPPRIPVHILKDDDTSAVLCGAEDWTTVVHREDRSMATCEHCRVIAWQEWRSAASFWFWLAIVFVAGLLAATVVWDWAQ